MGPSEEADRRLASMAVVIHRSARNDEDLLKLGARVYVYMVQHYPMRQFSGGYRSTAFLLPASGMHHLQRCVDDSGSEGWIYWWVFDSGCRLRQGRGRGFTSTK